MLPADLPVAAAAAAVPGPAYRGAVFAVAAAAAVALPAIAAAAATRHQVVAARHKEQAVAARHKDQAVAARHKDRAVAEMQQSSVVPVENSCQQALVLPVGTPAGTGSAAVPGVAAVTHSWAGGQGAGLGAACDVPPGHSAAPLVRAVQFSAWQQHCT